MTVDLDVGGSWNLLLDVNEARVTLPFQVR
jgi:hypothetical protein